MTIPLTAEEMERIMWLLSGEIDYCEELLDRKPCSLTATLRMQMAQEIVVKIGLASLDCPRLEKPHHNDTDRMDIDPRRN